MRTENILFCFLFFNTLMSSDGKGNGVVGGGAINEKKRYLKLPQTVNDKEFGSNFDPDEFPSHLLHAMFGLDRYPNYISRWGSNLEDAEKLEHALEQQLAKVRSQKKLLLDRNQAMKNLIEAAKLSQSDDDDIDWDVLKTPDSWEEIMDEVLAPEAVSAIFNSKQFKSSARVQLPSVQQVIDGQVNVQLDIAQLQDWLSEECFDVYSFPLLSQTFCERFKKAAKAIIKLSQTHTKENENGILKGLGRRPLDLDSIGASWVNDLLLHLIIQPLSKELFQKTEKFNHLDWRQGYLAGYSSEPSEKKIAQRHRLVPHTDDSEVTLNVGMGDDFMGGDLSFWNIRGTNEEGTHAGDFHPIIGTALIHAGRHLHEVKEVTRGDRYAFIIWARSWGSIRATTCPCCWMNRRHQEGSMTSNENKGVKHRCISGQ